MLSLIGYSQSSYFNITYNSSLDLTERAFSIIEVDGVGYLSIGPGRTDLGPPYSFTFLVMTDYNGDTMWTKIYIDSIKNLYPTKLIRTSDGNAAFCGLYIFENPLGGAIDSIYGLLAKINLQGDTLWTRVFKQNINLQNAFLYFEETNDNGFILCGSTYDTGVQKTDIYLVKTDSLGNLEWEYTYGGTYWEGANLVIQTQDGGYLVSGSNSIPPDTVLYVRKQIVTLKVDQNGIKKWEKYFDYYCVGTSSGTFAHETIDGDYIINGGIHPAGYVYDPDSMNCKGYAVKLDTAGNIIWERTYIDTIEYWYDPFTNDTLIMSANTIGGRVVGLADGSFVAIGETALRLDAYAWLVKIDKSGDLLWKRRFYKWDSGNEDNYFYDISQAQDGGFIICGTASKNALGLGGHDFWIVKVDSFGCDVPGCQDVGISPVHYNDFLITNAYPNPSDGQITIEINATFKGMIELKIINLLGEEIYSESISIVNKSYRQNLDISQYAKGIYFLNLSTAEGIISQKIIIQ